MLLVRECAYPPDIDNAASAQQPGRAIIFAFVDSHPGFDMELTVRHRTHTSACYFYVMPFVGHRQEFTGRVRDAERQLVSPRPQRK
jgi:hypothetical protein